MQPIACPSYDAWRGPASITGASLGYASASMDNAASNYGHVLLKLNTAGDTAEARSMSDRTFSFIADAPSGDMGVKVVFLGLVGGYQSSYATLLAQEQRYAGEQNRNIWECELDLSPVQTAYLVAHTWEVLRTHSRYYFMTENCAAGIIELLNLVVDRPLSPPSKVWVAPIDLFNQLTRERAGQPSLVRHISRVATGAGGPVEPVAQPHEGQRPSMIQTSWRSSSAMGERWEIRFRPAQNDLLTFAPGAAPGSEVSLFDIRLDYAQNRLSLDTFEVFRATNLNAGAPGSAWRRRMGAEQRDLSCLRCLELFAEGGWGKAASLGPNAAAYAYLNGRVDGANYTGSNLQAGPSAGVLFGSSRTWRASVEGGVWKEMDKAEDSRTWARVQVRFGASPGWDVRAGLDYQRLSGSDVTESRVSLARYW